MNPYRMAAFRLTELNAVDRRWVLERMPSTHRKRIRHELRKARTFHMAGLPSLAEVYGSRLWNDTSAIATFNVETLSRLDKVPPGKVFELLEELPLALRVEILRLRCWRWIWAYLDRLSTGKRASLVEHLYRGKTSMTVSARRALILLLVKTLTSETELDAEITDPTPFESLMTDSIENRADRSEITA